MAMVYTTEVSTYTGPLERVASVASGASAALFASLSSLRRKRFFHPEGETYGGTATFMETELEFPFIGETPALVRLSRGAGLPRALPDVLGLAVKFPDLGHDLLLATSGNNAVSRHLLLPASSFFSMTYSSVLPYELDDALIVFGARADRSLRDIDSGTPEDLGHLVASGELRFDLTLCRLGARTTETFASLVVDGHHEGDIHFNPWNCRAPLRPAGPLNRLRLETYQASQEARPSES